MKHTDIRAWNRNSPFQDCRTDDDSVFSAAKRFNDFIPVFGFGGTDRTGNESAEKGMQKMCLTDRRHKDHSRSISLFQPPQQDPQQNHRRRRFNHRNRKIITMWSSVQFQTDQFSPFFLLLQPGIRRCSQIDRSAPACCFCNPMKDCVAAERKRIRFVQN